MADLDLDRLEELAKKAVATEGKTRYCLEMEFQDAVTPEGFLALIERLRRAEKMLIETDHAVATSCGGPENLPAGIPDALPFDELDRINREACLRHAKRRKS